MAPIGETEGVPQLGFGLGPSDTGMIIEPQWRCAGNLITHGRLVPVGVDMAGGGAGHRRGIVLRTLASFSFHLIVSKDHEVPPDTMLDEGRAYFIRLRPGHLRRFFDNLNLFWYPRRQINSSPGLH